MPTFRTSPTSLGDGISTTRYIFFTVNVIYEVGVIFIISALFIKKHNIDSNKSKNIIILLMVTSIIATTQTMFEGLLCVLVTTACLVLLKLNNKHNKALNRIGAKNAPSG